MQTSTVTESCATVGGWPCQDFSAAGKSQGLRGSRAQLLYHLIRLVGALQQLQPTQPPAYVIENVLMQQHRQQQIACDDFNTITACLGEPVVLDAAHLAALHTELGTTGLTWWGPVTCLLLSTL